MPNHPVQAVAAVGRLQQAFGVDEIFQLQVDHFMVELEHIDQDFRNRGDRRNWGFTDAPHL
jgi:hypothetical protein